MIERRRALVQQSIRIAAEPGGVVLVQYRRHDHSPMGVLASLDPGGFWRLTRFDEDGISGHMLFPDKRAAVLNALTSGYRDTDRNLLRRLCRTARFRRCIPEV